MAALGLALPACAQADSKSGFRTAIAPMSTPRFGAIAAAPVDLGGVGISDDDGGMSVEGQWPAYVHVGDQLEAGTTWSGAVNGYQYDWQRCRATCVDIPGVGSSWRNFSDYTVTDADVGASLRIVITASNDDASASVTSGQVGPVLAPGVHLGDLWPAGLAFAMLMHTGAITVPVDVIHDDASTPEEVHYMVTDPGGGTDPIFPPLSGTVVFAAGEAQQPIEIPVLDHGVPILPPVLHVQLFGAAPLAVTAPASWDMTVTNADPAQYVRAPRNPLELPAAPPRSDPLSGASLFVDRTGTAVANAAATLSATDPTGAAMLNEIVAQPNVTRFGTWNGNYPGAAVSAFLDRSSRQEPGTVPMLATYKVVNSKLTHAQCGHWSDPPATQAEYHEWITNLAEGIGDRPAVLFLEMDSLITVGCLSPQGLAIRLNELHDAINVLSNVPHLVTYLDAGAADALPAKKDAGLLKSAGIAQIQGFFLNSTHFDWTRKEIKYGEQISKLTGGKHFVINTAENGQGPLVPRHRGKNGNEVLCNPPGRGLGPLPTTHTGYPNVDAFAWIANPGVSGGACRPGVPNGGVFSTTLALGLVRHANFRVR